MRIKFLREVEVELNAIPNVAWGRILKRLRTTSAPSINPITKQFDLPSAEMRNVFPAGAIVELPEQIAVKFVSDGSAEINVSPNGPRIASDRKEGIS